MTKIDILSMSRQSEGASPALLKAAAKALCEAYNRLPPDAQDERIRLLQELLQCPPSVMVEPAFTIEYGRHCRIGKGSFINHNVTIIDTCPITIGNQVLIGPNCIISSAPHRTTLHFNEDTDSQDGQPVTIGHRVWIGANCIICAGVTIGDNAVIGAGSRVENDIPANSVAYGKPARVQRKIKQNSQ
ncbi:sugar O-acetyltransferase [Alteromonas lipolytica]|uniref:Maltose/galactoside acetyltransferase domain-containing protein n=1 Tax=Alteromonas lipolytica TaxID=1856405 RepID=A0A1E8F9L8_9ALTE|nr:sugar O-acetyltransferase [Alteromonas lipolytica]OFI32233.1 hypothetical protein BFC17_08425 [Alteromonas lipolytica]GGF82789.1 O-acetyltransferase [Alteromonas lipolytica]